MRKRTRRTRGAAAAGEIWSSPLLCEHEEANAPVNIAIIGSGISGLVVARMLYQQHLVTVFEARDRVGGHVNTVEVEDSTGERLAIDTGFIVYNEYNYPLFSQLIRDLGVPSQPSNMSFGVRCDRTGLEYGTTSARSLFAQPRNVLSPSFARMLRDILRFNRRAGTTLREGTPPPTLREFLREGRFSERLSTHYLEPMGSALWSIPRGQVLDMPAELVLRFFENHRMLTVDDQPEWRVIQGGSRQYVRPLIEPFRDRIRTGRSVTHVTRSDSGATVDGEAFDAVVFACHSDQALSILDDPSPQERVVLGSLPYQRNEVVLHTDTSSLPARRAAWASWNYRISLEPDAPATVTYNMNSLQSLESPDTFCVTLNDVDSIAPERILYRTRMRHPRFTAAGLEAQRRRGEISGQRHTYYCGAYWGFGFHEDGVRSAVDVARMFEAA